jgi:hypothetical protein
MPVLYIRTGNPAGIIETYAQTVGTLQFLSDTEITLSPTLFTAPGVYVLFKYTTFSGGQTALDNFVTVKHDTLTPSNLTNDTVNNRVLVTLSV